MGAIIVGILVGGPVGVILLLLGVTCLVLAKRSSHSAWMAHLAKVGRVLPVVAVVGLPAGQLLFEHRVTSDALAIIAVSFLPLVALGSFCFWASRKLLARTRPS